MKIGQPVYAMKLLFSMRILFSLLLCVQFGMTQAQITMIRRGGGESPFNYHRYLFLVDSIAMDLKKQHGTVYVIGTRGYDLSDALFAYKARGQYHAVYYDFIYKGTTPMEIMESKELDTMMDSVLRDVDWLRQYDPFLSRPSHEGTSYISAGYPEKGLDEMCFHQLDHFSYNRPSCLLRMRFFTGLWVEAREGIYTDKYFIERLKNLDTRRIYKTNSSAKRGR